MNHHQSVLLHEAIHALSIRKAGVYVDATFGRGGHSRLILEALGDDGQLIAIDRDPDAIATGEKMAAQDARLTMVHGGFAELESILKRHHIQGIDGILLDLGVSSPQIDTAKRGFSFRFDAPLDMRMDSSQGISAKEWLAETEEKEIARVLDEYGEERFSRAIARAIVQKRQESPFETTAQLADLCRRMVKTHEKQDAATRTFQAIRIAVNDELGQLQTVLPQAAQALLPGGRLVVIAFHSLEDRIVKQFMRHLTQQATLPKWVMMPDQVLPAPSYRLVGKAQRATTAELAANPRARSAILRVLEKTTEAAADATR